MHAGKSPLGGGLSTKRCASPAPAALIVVTATLALAGLAMSQTVEYKTLKANRQGWSDGTLGSGYVKPDPNYRPDRTTDGQPDIQGIWSTTVYGAANRNESSLEAIPGTRVQSRVIDQPDGKVPYQPWARAKEEYFGQHYIDPQAACLPTGMPRQMTYREYQIIQAPGEVLILTEHSENFRHIPLDGRPHLPKDLKLWMGDSRGHWEGNTLVVDVTNQNDETWLNIRGDFHSDSLHVTERITPIDQNTIQDEITLDDPVVYARPWKMAFPLVRKTDKKYEVLEEYCAEGNKSIELQIDAGRKIFTGIEDAK